MAQPNYMKKPEKPYGLRNRDRGEWYRENFLTYNSPVQTKKRVFNETIYDKTPDGELIKKTKGKRGDVYVGASPSRVPPPPKAYANVEKEVIRRGKSGKLDINFLLDNRPDMDRDFWEWGLTVLSQYNRNQPITSSQRAEREFEMNRLRQIQAAKVKTRERKQ